MQVHILHVLLLLAYGRDPVGDCAVAGDLRWAGMFGVNVDFVARSHCSVALITIEDIQVTNFRPGKSYFNRLTYNKKQVKILNEPSFVRSRLYCTVWPAKLDHCKLEGWVYF